MKTKKYGPKFLEYFVAVGSTIFAVIVLVIAYRAHMPLWLKLLPLIIISWSQFDMYKTLFKWWKWAKEANKTIDAEE